jgi:hypothetical protein
MSWAVQTMDLVVREYIYSSVLARWFYESADDARNASFISLSEL